MTLLQSYSLSWGWTISLKTMVCVVFMHRILNDLCLGDESGSVLFCSIEVCQVKERVHGYTPVSG